MTTSQPQTIAILATILLAVIALIPLRPATTLISNDPNLTELEALQPPSSGTTATQVETDSWYVNGYWRTIRGNTLFHPWWDDSSQKYQTSHPTYIAQPITNPYNTSTTIHLSAVNPMNVKDCHDTKATIIATNPTTKKQLARKSIVITQTETSLNVTIPAHNRRAIMRALIGPANRGCGRWQGEYLEINTFYATAKYNKPVYTYLTE